MSEQSDKRLNELLDLFVNEGVPGCALAVSYEGETVFEGFRGYARLEDEEKIGKDTVYRIFSNSKNITATAVMILYERGLLLLSDPLEKYLPFFSGMKYKKYDASGELIVRPVSRSITIRDLLMMTSGIPYYGQGSITTLEYEEAFGKGLDLSVSELARQISRIPLAFDPGTRWTYGLGYDVLGAVIEVVSGKKFSKFVEDEICKPLKMKSTSFYCTHDQKRRMANIYSRQNGKYEIISNDMFIAEENQNKLESGGGGMISELGDLLRFATMWAMGGSVDGYRILSRNTIDLMRTNHLQGQPLQDFQEMSEIAYPWYRGYGWGLGGRTLIDKAAAGSNGSVGEFGWCGAAGTYILADPAQKLAIAYAHQMMPVIGGMQDYCHPRVRNAVYSLLDEWCGA